MNKDSNPIQLKDDQAQFKPVSRDEFFQRFQRVNDLLQMTTTKAQEGGTPFQGPPGVFCREKDVVFSEREAESGDSPSIPIETDHTIFSRSRGTSIEYLAKISGYLIIKDGVISIFEPSRVTPDKVIFFFIFYPVSTGKKDLLETFWIAAHQPCWEPGKQEYTQDMIEKIIDTEEIQTIILSTGILPQYGKSSRLTINVHPDKFSEKVEGDKINFYLYSKYQEIPGDTILAEIEKGCEGVVGVTAFGEQIPVEQPRPINFSAGQNVREETDEQGTTRYISEVTGILNLSEKSVGIMDLLHIKGDVCKETGSLYFSGDIIVDGAVHSLYRIQCGGNLTIQGTIENGAEIICEGDLIAAKGVVGEKTRVQVNGNMEADFFQDLHIRVQGNLTVRESIYASIVFCGGTLHVEGKNIKNKIRGSILGSQVSSMKGIVLHSIGSIQSKNTIICGFDRELNNQLITLEKTIPVINKKILGLQNKIGLDLTKKGIGEELKNLPAFRKKKIKEYLELIKGFAIQKKELETRFDSLKNKAVHPHPEDLVIQITNHVIPDTTIIISSFSTQITIPLEAVNFRLKESEIKIEQLNKNAPG